MIFLYESLSVLKVTGITKGSKEWHLILEKLWFISY